MDEKYKPFWKDITAARSTISSELHYIRFNMEENGHKKEAGQIKELYDFHVNGFFEDVHTMIMQLDLPEDLKCKSIFALPKE